MERTEKTILGVFLFWCLGCVYVLQNVNVNVPQNSVYEMVVMLFVAFLLGYFLRREISHLEQEPEKSKPIILSMKDDLKMLEGIGPAIEKILNSAGINTYRDLANTELSALKEIL